MKIGFFDDFRLGVITGAGIVDVTSAVKGIPHVGPHDLINGLIADFARHRPALETAATAGKPIPLANVRLRPPLPRPATIDCMAVNYMEDGTRKEPAPINAFHKSPSAIIGPDDDVEIPRNSVKTDWEVELGVVIGKSGRYIPEADALSHVAGYCVINDVSEREFQTERGGQWDKGKGCDTFGPTGPWLVTPDEAGDVGNLKMWLEVDGVRRQNGSTATMIFKVAHLISYCSQFMSFQAGDIISTGTPPGVGLGFKPPIFLKGGEVMTLGIENLGQQTQRVVRA